MLGSALQRRSFLRVGAALAGGVMAGPGLLGNAIAAPDSGGPSQKAALVAKVNGRYVTAARSGTSRLIANQAIKGPSETFEVVDLGGGNVALRSASSGNYVCAESGGGSWLVANRGAAGPWETFALVRNRDGSVSLRAVNGRYVCAENAGASPLIANRSAIGSWECFDLQVETQVVRPKYGPVSFSTLAEARSALSAPADAEYVYWPSGSTAMLEEVFMGMSDNQILVLPERDAPYEIDSADGFRAAGISWITGQGGRRVPIVGKYRGRTARTWFAMARARRGILGLGPGAVVRPSASAFRQERQIYPGAVADTGWSMVGAAQKLIETSTPNAYFGNFVMQGRDFGGVAYHGLSSSKGAVYENLYLDAAHRGFARIPNGETGGISVVGPYEIKNVEVNCRDRGTGARVGSSPIMINSSAGGRMEHVYTHEPVTGGVTLWNCSGAHEAVDLRTEYGSHGLNLEASRPGFSFTWTGGSCLIDYRHLGEYPGLADGTSDGSTGLHLGVRSPHGSQKIAITDVAIDRGPASPALAVQIYGSGEARLQKPEDITRRSADGSSLPVRLYS